TVDAPSIYSLSIDNRTEELIDANEALVDSADTLEAAFNSRSSYNSSHSNGEELITEAVDLLDSTADEVLSEDAHTALSEHIDSLQEALEADLDESSSEAFASGVTAIDDASDNVRPSIAPVTESRAEWTKGEEEAGRTERASYSKD